MRRRTLLIIVVLATLLCGCARTGYYLQSVQGQLDLMSRREPIEHMLRDPATPPELRVRLETVTDIREFASRELGLPDNRSYRSYADLERPYVVWNVFAAPALSVEPRTWCFPFVGCVAYRGYFAEQNAVKYATTLEADGDDVYVAGIAAYSTLGRFADPVLNTMLRGDDIYLAGLVFHELSHQQLYIRNATEFNESFASLVEEEGVRRWLAARDDTTSWAKWQYRQQLRAEFVKMVGHARAQLAELYATSLPESDKRQRKHQIIDDLRSQHERMRERLGADTSYEQWFAGPLNNAQLSSVATYTRLVPAFRVMLDRVDQDMARFYARAVQVGEMPAIERDLAMTELLKIAEQRNLDEPVLTSPEG